eukprot:PhF_6_TR33653/c5_g2_i2/m.49228
MYPANVQTIYVVPSPIPQQSQGQLQQQQCVPMMYSPPPIYCYTAPPTATQQHHLLPIFPVLNTTMEGSTSTNANFVISNSMLSLSSSLGLDVSSNSNNNYNHNHNNNGPSKQMKYKTSLCRSFASPGQQCPYGEKCQFAHGERELRPIPPK